MRFQNIVNGKVGEYRVASELLLRGYDVFMPSVDKGVDLLLDNGKHIQVKTSYGNNLFFHSSKSMKARIKDSNVKLEPHMLNNVDIIILWLAIPNEFYIMPASEIRGIAELDIREIGNYKQWSDYLNNWSILGDMDINNISGRHMTGYVGKSGEYRVISELLFRGYDVLQPVADSGIDLYSNNKAIQIKTARAYHTDNPYPHRSYNFNFILSATPSHGIKVHHLERVDCVILWAVDEDDFYIIPADKIRGKTGIQFTADHDKRTQSKWNRWLPYRNNWDVLNGILPEIPDKKEFECQQCGYKWEALVVKPTRCPNCHARYHIKRERQIVDGQVVSLTKEQKNEINKVECSRVRWAKELGKSIQEIESHEEVTCKQCGYKWTPIKDNPEICPYCHGFWNVDRKREIIDGNIIPRTKEELRVISSQNANKRWGKDIDRIIDEDKIKELYEQGYSCPKIAKQLNLGSVTVWQVVKKFGIIRSRSEGIKLSWSDRKVNDKQLSEV